MRNLISLFSVSILFLFQSCGESTDTNVTKEDINREFIERQPQKILESEGIKLIEANDFPLFSDCALHFKGDSSIMRFGPNKFSFDLNKYSLHGSTTDENKKGVRVHNEGQFLYVINNKNGIEKFANTSFDYELTRGKNSFLIVPSRSYEMSIKNKESFLAFEYYVDNLEDPAEYKMIEEPGVFICSPNGRYSEGVSQRVLFDFFIINTELSEEGNYVELKIDNKWTFDIHQWTPFYVDGLKAGRHSFKITLNDKSGTPLKGEYGSYGPVYFSLKQVNLN